MLRATLLAFLLLAPLAAHAHEPRIGPRGGALVDAGPHHVEVVPAPGGLDVFVSDANDRPLPATGFRGIAILAVGGKPLRIPLEPRQPDRLSGPATLPAGEALKGVIQLTAPDGRTATARFGQ
jgi:hypothetical protein